MISSLIKSLIILWHWIELFVSGLLLAALSFLPDRVVSPFYFQLTRAWCTLFTKALNTKMNVYQKYKGSLPEQYIVIANHPSAFEDAGLTSLFNAYPVAKEGVKKWFLVGRISKKAGIIFVRRSSPQSRSKAYKEMINRLNKGHNIALYPEGGCTGRTVSPFLLGAFRSSVETDVPIVPVFIHYHAQEAFEWDGQTLPQKLWQIITSPSHTADYYIFEPIYPTPFKQRTKHNSEFYKQNDEFNTELANEYAAKHMRDSAFKQYKEWQEKYLK